MPPHELTFGAKPYAGSEPFFFGTMSSLEHDEPFHGASHLQALPAIAPFSEHARSETDAAACATASASARSFSIISPYDFSGGCCELAGLRDLCYSGAEVAKNCLGIGIAVKTLYAQ